MTTHSSRYRSSAVGHIIREHRKARGLTQKQLACELGVEARTLRMYENGERVLENISDLRRIADLLEIDPVELGLAASKHDIATATQVQEIVERVASLIPQARFVEARTTIDTFFRNLNLKRQSGNEDPVFLRALALRFLQFLLFLPLVAVGKDRRTSHFAVKTHDQSGDAFEHVAVMRH